MTVENGAPVSRLIFILKGYPRLSETFIAQEIQALEERGFAIDIVSLRFPTDKHVHPVHREIAAKARYLPEYLYQEPWRVLRSWVKAGFRRGYWRAFGQWIKDLLRDPTPNRARRFGQACVMVAEVPKDATRLHAHFLHTPASATYYAHLITGMRWSCSAHAKDIWTSPDWDKREKLATLDWLVTCTRDGYEHLREIAAPADRDKINLVYHGLDFERFPEPPSALLIVDINIPQMDGLTFLRTLRRKAPPMSTMPALVISTESEPQRIAAAMAAGANLYLVKPLSEQSLVEYASLLCGVAHG